MAQQTQCHEDSSSGRKASILAGSVAGSTGSGSGGGGGAHAPLQNTVFIHKLYNILEDDDLKDLIWWSSGGTSFLIRPTERFSRALATYFKHTNIASFVRQLNMYGFHKVSNDHGREVQHAGADDGVKIWEFRHSMGIFKRGDIEGLKFIKRRSSRNIATLNGRKNSSSQLDDGEGGKQRAQSAVPAAPAPPPPPPPPQQQPQQPQQWQPWPPSQFVVSADDDPQQQQPLAPQVGLTTYPSSDSIFNQQFQQQQLETRFAELSQSYSGLRYDYTNLQYRNDGLLEQLRVLNLEMVKLLDFVQGFVALQGASSDLFKDSTFNGDAGKQNQFRQHQKDLSSLEQEMLKFKSGLVQRYQKNMETLQQQQASLSQQQPQMVPYGAGVVHGHATPSLPKEMRPLSRSSIPTNSSAAAAFAPHLFSIPSAPAGATFQQPGTFISPADHFSGPRMVMMNPFETTGQTSTAKRNMSILMDPLSSAPNAPGLTSSPSRPLPGTLGSQIPRNPSPLVNSSKPPKQEAPQGERDPQGQAGNINKRTSRISLKDGTFLLKPSKNNSVGNPQRNSINSDGSSRSEGATVPSASGGVIAAPAIEQGGPKDASAIGLPFRTFYTQGTNGDQAKDESNKNEHIPSTAAALSFKPTQNTSLHNVNHIARIRSAQSSPRQVEPKKVDLETPEPTETGQHTILSPIPSRFDMQNRRASSGVYSLLNTESESPRSSNDPNPKKKTKL